MMRIQCGNEAIDDRDDGLARRQLREWTSLVVALLRNRPKIRQLGDNAVNFPGPVGNNARFGPSSAHAASPRASNRPSNSTELR